MNSLHIRDAHPSDRYAIRDVTLSAYNEYAALMPSHWEGYRQDILATLADVKPAEQVVAEQDGAIVGAVLLYPAGTVFSSPDGASIILAWPEVRLLAVAPAAGVGLDALRAQSWRASPMARDQHQDHKHTTQPCYGRSVRLLWQCMKRARPPRNHKA